MTAQGAAQALETLLAIISDQPPPPDLRPQSEIDRDMALEQAAEDRKAARTGAFDGEASQRWLADRRAG